MGFILLPDAPFFSGGSSSSLVPALYDVAVAGIPFMIDRKYTGDQTNGAQWETIDLLKPQQDSAATPGEHSLTPDGLWRRAMESWHLGAGQSYLDRPDSDGARFRSSKGLDPSTRWQLSLLPDTARIQTVTYDNAFLAVAGDRLYSSDGQQVFYRTTLTGSPTLVSPYPTATVKSMCSDGFHVYVAYSTTGIAITDSASSSFTPGWSALTADVINYAKGYIVAGVANHLYSINGTGTSALLFTHLNSDFKFVDITDGPNAIYAAGYSGDKSVIYSIGFKSDGTGLDAAIPAGSLPDGEIVRSIQGYLDFVLVGTDKGVRFCTTDSQTGALSVGALIPAAPVNCFEGQDRFVWFGWSDYDASSSGLGRLDLEFINPGPAPAYWSDLMATTQGAVTAVATFAGKRVFAVASDGVYAEQDALVAAGTMDSGNITYTLPDEKTAVAVDIRHRTLPADGGSYTEWIALDGDAFTEIGTHDSVLTTDAHGATFSAGQKAGETIELRHVLTRGTDTADGPTLTRITLKALPRANTQQRFVLPLVISDELTADNLSIPNNPNFILRALRAIRALQQVVTLQRFDETFAVVIDSLTFYEDGKNPAGTLPRGTLVLRAKTLDASA